MTINKLANKIAKAEGKKHQASVGDVREVVKLICVEFAAAQTEGTLPELVSMFVKAGTKASK